MFKTAVIINLISQPHVAAWPMRTEACRQFKTVRIGRLSVARRLTGGRQD